MLATVRIIALEHVPAPGSFILLWINDAGHRSYFCGLTMPTTVHIIALEHVRAPGSFPEQSARSAQISDVHDASRYSFTFTPGRQPVAAALEILYT